MSCLTQAKETNLEQDGSDHERESFKQSLSVEERANLMKNSQVSKTGQDKLESK